MLIDVLNAAHAALHSQPPAVIVPAWLGLFLFFKEEQNKEDYWSLCVTTKGCLKNGVLVYTLWIEQNEERRHIL